MLINDDWIGAGMIEALICENCNIVWHRKQAPGRKPRTCDQCGSKSERVAPPAPQRDWRDKAACIEAESALFFPNTKDHYEHEYEAFMVCNRCEVRQECLRYAVEHHETIGIYGGMTPKQRQKMSGKVSA